MKNQRPPERDGRWRALEGRQSIGWPRSGEGTTLETQRFVEAVAANTVIAEDAATGEQAVRDCEEDAG